MVRSRHSLRGHPAGVRSWRMNSRQRATSRGNGRGRTEARAFGPHRVDSPWLPNFSAIDMQSVSPQRRHSPAAPTQCWPGSLHSGFQDVISRRRLLEKAGPTYYGFSSCCTALFMQFRWFARVMDEKESRSSCPGAIGCVCERRPSSRQRANGFILM